MEQLLDGSKASIERRIEAWYYNCSEEVKNEIRREASLDPLNFKWPAAESVKLKKEVIEDYIKTVKGGLRPIKGEIYDLSGIPELVDLNMPITVRCTSKICGVEIGEFETFYNKLINKCQEHVLFLRNSQALFDKYTDPNLVEDTVRTKRLKDLILASKQKDGVDISKIKVVDWKEIPVCFTCKKCGRTSWKKPDHIVQDIRKDNIYSICGECGKRNKSNLTGSLQKIIEKSREMYNGKYKILDTDPSIYKRYRTTNIHVYCTIHDYTFITHPHLHFQNKYGGCPLCGIEATASAARDEMDVVNLKLEKLYNGRYEAGFTSYTDKHKKYDFIDTKTGEVINMCLASALRGSLKPGGVNKSSGESLVCDVLDKMNIKYDFNVSLLNGDALLSLTGKIRPDFQFSYSQKNYIIEYNGEQHYQYISYFWERCGKYLTEKDKKQAYMDHLDRDERLRQYCKEKGIIYIEIPYTYHSFDKIFETLDEILNHNKSPEELIKLPQIERLVL